MEPEASNSTRAQHKSSSQRWRPFSTSSSSYSELVEEAQTESESDADEDPYFAFQEDLHTKLDLVEDALATYLDLVHQTVSHV